MIYSSRTVTLCYPVIYLFYPYFSSKFAPKSIVSYINLLKSHELSTDPQTFSAVIYSWSYILLSIFLVLQLSHLFTLYPYSLFEFISLTLLFYRLIWPPHLIFLWLYRPLLPKNIVVFQIVISHFLVPYHAVFSFNSYLLLTLLFIIVPNPTVSEHFPA